MRIDHVFTAIFGGLIPLIGIALLGGGVLAYLAGEHARERGFTTTGTVVELAETYGEEGDILYAPIVRYTTNEGKDVEFRGGIWSRPSWYERGQTVEVFFYPDDPNGAVIDSAASRYVAPAILGGIGLVFAAAGAIFLLVRFLVFGRSRAEASIVGPGATA